MMWHRKLGSIYFAVVRMTESDNGECFMYSFSEQQLEAFKGIQTRQEYRDFALNRSAYQYSYGLVERLSDGRWYKRSDIESGKVKVEPKRYIDTNGVFIEVSEKQYQNRFDRPIDGELVNIRMRTRNTSKIELVSFHWWQSMMRFASRGRIAEGNIITSEAKAKKVNDPKGKVGLGFEVDFVLEWQELRNEVEEVLDIMNQELC
ncbi:hypothetical protein PM116P6_00047 [Parabacteroides phage PM116P6]|nr:hypothetical protein PM116P6_00047 [Parabacteroides phage PM116P6]WAX17618.1 hypothetical protein PM116P7_00003 [Parabacteroides phage PM116P7]